MVSWIAGIAVFLVVMLLFVWLRNRARHRRSSTDMRDYMRRNYRIGEKPWE